MHRRMIALVAGLAIGASALLGAAPASAADPPPSGGFSYVALGDSEAAGTGLLPYAVSDCLRSYKAYPIILAPMYGGVAASTCAGATTADATQQAVVAAQAGRLGPATELVTITVGMNDVDWQQVLLACSSAGSTPACQTAFGGAILAAQGLPSRIGTLVGTVRSVAPNAHIVVASYPVLFGDLTDSCSIGSFQGTTVSVSPQQAALANTGVTAVNQAIAAGALGYAQQTGDPLVSYVDIGAAFDGHGLCDSSGPWVSGLVNGNPTSDRSLHLNWPGQRAYAAAITAEF